MLGYQTAGLCLHSCNFPVVPSVCFSRYSFILINVAAVILNDLAKSQHICASALRSSRSGGRGDRWLVGLVENPSTKQPLTTKILKFLRTLPNPSTLLCGFTKCWRQAKIFLYFLFHKSSQESALITYTKCGTGNQEHEPRTTRAWGS